MRRGFCVTIYEKHKDIGGLLAHGIPDFRLPRDVLRANIQRILDLGINVVYGKEIGNDITLEELKQKYDAVLLAFGANVSSKMNIAGEDLKRSLWRQ